MLDTRSRTATVIKAGSAGPMLRSLSTVDLADHLSAARGIVESAKSLAVKIESDMREDGHNRAAEAKEVAMAEGYDAGFAQGEVAGQAKAFKESKQDFDPIRQGHHVDHRSVISQIMDFAAVASDIGDAFVFEVVAQLCRFEFLEGVARFENQALRASGICGQACGPQEQINRVLIDLPDSHAEMMDKVAD